MPERIELLQGMPIFGAIREDALAFLLERARRVTRAAGEFFFREGERSESMFVLESGRVDVLKHWQSREFVLHSFGPGDCFGEMALLDLAPRSASVRAAADSEALELGAAALYDLCKHDTEQFALIQMNIGREVCRRLRATDDALFRASMGERGAIPGPWPRAA
jgi:CRP/FNR family transcriptional regulator, cyclic AMP receptor protein